jgi:hypothetical protein
MRRFHHYLFAHRLLPLAVFSDPEHFEKKLEADGMQFLRFLWDTAAADEAVDIVLDAEGLDFEIHATPYGKVVEVRMPEPAAPPEAHTVMVVLASSPRVFTLERSVDPESGNPSTMLCEWDRNGQHLNHGQGPGLEGLLSRVLLLVVAQSWTESWRSSAARSTA